MSDNDTYTPFQAAWLNFTKSVRTLLVAQLDDRPLDQYLAFRDAVIALVHDREFLNSIADDKVWPRNADQPVNRFRDALINALIMELNAFPLAIEIAQATEKSPEESKSLKRKWLGRAST